MKKSSFVGIFMFALFLVILVPQPAMAYVGPGAGIAALGALLAIIAGVIAAIFGFLWYPIKRLLQKRKQSKKDQQGEEE
ncbi:hypothetical protein H1P_310044 [Hyella patelloides LEGE 07179]|uniref:Uncharacterized protein n=1 Tax=Hyella patelloides LEGE 07179 TaxID=945734 RepID=A0A563VUQ5_9CYAN|nr:hypothetical protein [Hyella patelloides]VEP15143.1 hypothetical protein H1P_310044 [Hyella patelloides LEGE 07179]